MVDYDFLFLWVGNAFVFLLLAHLSALAIVWIFDAVRKIIFVWWNIIFAHFVANIFNFGENAQNISTSQLRKLVHSPTHTEKLGKKYRIFRCILQTDWRAIMKSKIEINQRAKQHQQCCAAAAERLLCFFSVFVHFLAMLFCGRQTLINHHYFRISSLARAHTFQSKCDQSTRKWNNKTCIIIIKSCHHISIAIFANIDGDIRTDTKTHTHFFLFLSI